MDRPAEFKENKKPVNYYLQAFIFSLNSVDLPIVGLLQSRNINFFHGHKSLRNARNLFGATVLKRFKHYG